ncbi:SIR2 family protein [Lentimicrobium sp. S6]|uniref:SIR2 family protein n=1 Tax=Lentimicrobium sp. S6 TaxID=2735872 RepID=UPI001C1311D6|nr:SIR2 family protein [Lentimicrobium sp. S6]
MKNMKNSHDPIKQIRFLSQTLSNDKKPLSFFLSAGCPLGVEMPEDKWPLIPAIKELSQKVNAELLNEDKVHLRYAEFIEEIKKDGKDHENIELVLSFARSLTEVSIGGAVRGFSQEELIELEKQICLIIAKLINVELPDEITPYHKFASWIASIDREKAVEIFTTNYDLLMEQALEETSVPYFDGFVGARNTFFDLRAIEENAIPNHWTRLWKIHGSLNWYQSENAVHRSTGSNIQNQESHLIYPSHLKYDQSRKMPYLALIDRLTSSIKKEPSVLISTGYSFNDEHINDSILNALKANPTSMVIALLFGNLSDYPRAEEIAKRRPNISLWAFDKAIIGTKKGDWQPVDDFEAEDNIGNVIKKEEKDDPENPESKIISWKLTLGDFSRLGDFLQELVGNENEEN